MYTIYSPSTLQTIHITDHPHYRPSTLQSTHITLQSIHTKIDLIPDDLIPHHSHKSTIMSARESASIPTLHLPISQPMRIPHSLGNTPVTISPAKGLDILDAFRIPYCGWHWVYEPRKGLDIQSTTTGAPTSNGSSYTYLSGSSLK